MGWQVGYNFDLELSRSLTKFLIGELMKSPLVVRWRSSGGATKILMLKFLLQNSVVVFKRWSDNLTDEKDSDWNETHKKDYVQVW